MLNGKANFYFYLGLWKLGLLSCFLPCFSFCHRLIYQGLVAASGGVLDSLLMMVLYRLSCVSCLNTYGFTNYPVQGQKIFFFPWSDWQGSLEFLLCRDLWLLPAIILAFHLDSWCNTCDFLLLSSLVLLSFIFLMDWVFFFYFKIKGGINTCLLACDRRVGSGCSILAKIYKILHFWGNPPLGLREDESLMEIFTFPLPTIYHKMNCNVKETWAICTSLLTSLLTINTFCNCTWKINRVCWCLFSWEKKMFDKLTLGRRCSIHTLNMKIWVH